MKEWTNEKREIEKYKKKDGILNTNILTRNVVLLKNTQGLWNNGYELHEIR